MGSDVQVDVVMPFLSETMEEGWIVAWHKDVGESVAVGDDLVEIETDKLCTVYESDTDGVIADLIVPVGSTVPCGTVIARIHLAGSA